MYLYLCIAWISTKLRWRSVEFFIRKFTTIQHIFCVEPYKTKTNAMIKKFRISHREPMSYNEFLKIIGKHIDTHPAFRTKLEVRLKSTFNEVIFSWFFFQHLLVIFFFMLVSSFQTENLTSIIITWHATYSL